MRADRIPRLARDERVARHAGFWWGLAEGLFFFIVPDVYISLAALFSLRAGAVAWVASIAGSVTAIPIVYLLTTVLRVDYLEFLERIPGISGALVDRVAQKLVSEGLPFTPLLVLGGVPLKLYAALAFWLGTSLGGVILWTVFARIVRIAPTFAIVGTLRLLFGRRIDAHPFTWTVVAGLFWLGFYTFYFIAMSRV